MKGKIAHLFQLKENISAGAYKKGLSVVELTIRGTGEMKTTEKTK